MLVMAGLWQVRRRRGAGRVGVADWNVAERISDEGKWTEWHHCDQDYLAPSRKPGRGEPDHRAHHRDIQSAVAEPVASLCRAGKPLASTASRYTPPLRVVIQKLVGQSVS